MSDLHGESGGGCRFSAPPSRREGESRNQGGRDGHPASRVTGRVACCAQGPAGPGEGGHPRQGRGGRRAPRAAGDRGHQGLHLHRPGRAGEPARPVRRAPPADHLPLHVAARRSPGSLAKIRAARPARSWPTASATYPTCMPAIPRWCWCPGRRSPASSGSRSGWAGRCRGTPRPAATSTTTSTSASTRTRTPLEYNYKDKETLEREAPYIRSGADGPGVSVFLREGDRIFHTYSAYERGLDSLLGTYRWLELTPLGRQRHVIEFPYHDTYDHGLVMIEGLAARWLLTVVFAAAGPVERDARWAALPREDAARQPSAGRASAVFCGVMCAALIAMTWRPEPAAATWLQAALFGSAALWFGLASLAGSGRVRRPVCLLLSCADGGCHDLDANRDACRCRDAASRVCPRRDGAHVP